VSTVSPVTAEVTPARKARLDSEQGLLLLVGALVLVGAVAVLAVAGW
jgi:hypothetical protein